MITSISRATHPHLFPDNPEWPDSQYSPDPSGQEQWDPLDPAPVASHSGTTNADQWGVEDLVIPRRLLLALNVPPMAKANRDAGGIPIELLPEPPEPPEPRSLHDRHPTR